MELPYRPPAPAGWLCAAVLSASVTAAPEPEGAASHPPVAETAPAESAAVGERSAPQPGEPYRDQLIDPDVTPDPTAEELTREDGELPWFAAGAYRLGLREDDAGDLVEHGVSGHYQKDTANWGRIQFDLLGRSSDFRGPGGESGADGHFTLTQTGLPLASGWFADSGLGVQRSQSDELVASSYRLHLPSSIVNGVTTRIGDGEHEYRFTWGRVGRIEGLFSRTFESEDNRLAGAGYSRDFGQGWRFGAELWHVDADDGPDDVQSVAAAVEYATPEEDRSDQLHLLADSDGDSGIWYDGYRLLGRWEHRFGAFRLEPNLAWQNAAVVNDREGAYYRFDYRRPSATYNAGVDVSRARSTDRSDYRLFTGARWRLGVDRSVGGQASLGALEPATATLPGRQPETRRDWRLTTFYTRTHEMLDNRVELSAAGLKNTDDERRYQLSLDQFWIAQALRGLTTRFELERRELDSERLDQVRAGLTYRRQFAGGLSLDTGVLLVSQDQPGGGDAEGANLHINLNWPFHQDWSLNMNAVHNRNVVSDPLVPVQTDSMTGNQLFLSLSYGRSGGRLPGVVGAGSAERGIGRITGYVFFDENRDGRRSPGEDPAEGLVVRLDGIVTVVTDAQGRFEFWPVAAGTHRVEIGVGSVPLPWEPARPVNVTVQPRGEAFQDLPLQRIDE